MVLTFISITLIFVSLFLLLCKLPIYLVKRMDEREEKYRKHINQARYKLHKQVTFANCLLPIESEVAE